MRVLMRSNFLHHSFPPSGPVGRWRLCVGTLSSREFVTFPSTSSSWDLSTACCTTSWSWRGSASTTRPLTKTSGTVEVRDLHLYSSSFTLHFCARETDVFILLPPPAALADISEIVLQLQGTMMKMENFQKLLELKKDLTGIDNLVTPGRVSSTSLRAIRPAWSGRVHLLLKRCC